MLLLDCLLVHQLLLKRNHSFILSNSLIADCTSIQDRNRYLAILEAFISAGYIVGPAIGGFLGQVSYSFPLYCAGVVAGIAFIFAAIFLDESNKDVHRIYNIRREVRGKSKGIIYEMIMIYRREEEC